MEPPSSSSISVSNQTGRAADTGLIERAVTATLAHHGHEGAAVDVLLTDDGHIRQLNRDYRSLDEPTDVLTFPSGGGPSNILGDIAIAVPYAERQAELRGVDLDQELAFLAIHGALHLCGLDDESEADRAEMMREMNAIAVHLGLPGEEEWTSLLHEAGK